MRIILTFVFLLTIRLTAFPQEIDGSNQTTSLCGGRWEFFMSDIAVMLTFKVDKFTGEVFQLVQTKDKILAWTLIGKETSIKDIQKQDFINYLSRPEIGLHELTCKQYAEIR